MSNGTSLPDVITALTALPSSRAGLSGVPFTDSGPVKAVDLQNDSGAWEAIWVENARAPEIEIPTMGVPVTYDESIDLDVVVQVLKRVTDPGDVAITQLLTTTRAAALLGEVIGAVAADPSLGIAATAAMPMGVEVTVKSWQQVGGWLKKGDERGARFLLTLNVFARLEIT